MSLVFHILLDLHMLHVMHILHVMYILHFVHFLQMLNILRIRIFSNFYINVSLSIQISKGQITQASTSLPASY